MKAASLYPSCARPAMVALATLAAIPAAQAQGTGQTPDAVFQRLCVGHMARPDAVAAAARAEGFVPATRDVPTPAGMEQAIKLERAGSPRLVLVVGSGQSAVNPALAGAVPVAACSLFDASGAWDARAYARQWLGLAPLADEGGLAIYSYADRPGGRAVDDAANLPQVVADANAGALRALVAMQLGGMAGLSWTVMQKPATPLALPAAVDRMAQPFAPCTWQAAKYGTGFDLMCPVAGNTAPEPQTAGAAKPDTPDKARAGDVAAMLALAGLYAQGPAALRDGAAAREWARRAAEAGSADGAFDLALALETGLGGPADAAGARTWYERAAQGGRAEARINLAGMMIAAGEAPAAVALLEPAAQAGDAAAAFALGHMAENGLGGPRDMARAQDWYARAGERASNAQTRLGQIAEEGLGGTTPDPAAALRHYGAAAKATVAIGEIMGTTMGAAMAGSAAKNPQQVSPQQAMLLGLYLASASKRDYARAIPLLQSAAQAGQRIAMLRLAQMAASGTGMARDDKAALALYHQGLLLDEAARFNAVRRFRDRPTPPARKD